jgi:hypothetical protein
MEARHVRWAIQHDWYRSHSYNTISGKWIVCVHDSLTDESEWFKCIDQLKHWAGY